MNLFVLRHAIAFERGTPGYENDADRALTGLGKKRLKRAIDGMKMFGVTFDLVISSPYARALETAQITATEYGIASSFAISEHLAPGGELQDLIDQLDQFSESYRNIVVVGHEPDLSSLVSLLTTGDPHSLSLWLKKSGLCKLAIDELIAGRCASLEWLLTSKQLRQLRSRP